jgi:NAD(P)-dependent dehydrogenase (short-subunit alcohol dehydrogenase family)
MTGRTIVITGASDGVGAAAARLLSQAGEQVVVVGRSPQKTAAVADELGVPYHLVDYSRLADVRRLAAELNAAYPRIDVLANNAGGLMSSTRTLTEDGNELTFQVNHLGGFLLTTLLMDKLIASKAAVIQTSSVAARLFARLDLGDLTYQRRYQAHLAYGGGKLANILFTHELQRRFGDQGLNAAAFHPGVVGSNFASSASGVMRWLYGSRLAAATMISPARGADQLVWLAEGTPGTDWTPGGYYEKRRLAKSSALAEDAELARRLWEVSTELICG